MNSRDRIRRALKHRTADRVPLTEICFWPQAIDRWHREGLPRDVDPTEHLGMDRFSFISYDDTLGLEERVLAEFDDKIVKTDKDGRRIICMKNSSDYFYSPPQPIDHFIKTEEDWFCNKGRLEPNLERAFVLRGSCNEKQSAHNFLDDYEELRKEDAFLCLFPLEPCWKALWMVLGYKIGLTSMLTNPRFICDMIGTYTDLLIRMYKTLSEKGVEIDGVWLRGDLCFKDGMFFSPDVYNRLVYPNHKRLTDFFNAKKIPVIHHCDGNVSQYIPLLIRAGFRAIQPLEAIAGNDIRELKDKWGDKIAFIGNISKESLGGSRKQIEKEIESKVSKAKERELYFSFRSLSASFRKLGKLLLCHRGSKTGRAILVADHGISADKVEAPTEFNGGISKWRDRIDRECARRIPDYSTYPERSLAAS